MIIALVVPDSRRATQWAGPLRGSRLDLDASGGESVVIRRLRSHKGNESATRREAARWAAHRAAERDAAAIAAWREWHAGSRPARFRQTVSLFGHLGALVAQVPEQSRTKRRQKRRTCATSHNWLSLDENYRGPPVRPLAASWSLPLQVPR